MSVNWCSRLLFIKVFWLNGRLALKPGMAGHCCFDPIFHSDLTHTQLSGACKGEAVAKPSHSPCVHLLSRKRHAPFRAWAPHTHRFTFWKGKSVGIFKVIVLLCAINSLPMSFKKLKSGLIFQILKVPWAESWWSILVLLSSSLSVLCCWIKGEHISLSFSMAHSSYFPLPGYRLTQGV